MGLFDFYDKAVDKATMALDKASDAYAEREIERIRPEPNSTANEAPSVTTTAQHTVVAQTAATAEKNTINSTFWEQHKTKLMIGGGAVFGVLALIAVMSGRRK